MPDLSRRGFLGQMSITTGLGIAGGLGLHKLLATDAPAASAQPATAQGPNLQPAAMSLVMKGVALAGPMVLHVRDLANAEISMMVGTQELVYRDPELVARLVQTASSGTRAEG